MINFLFQFIVLALLAIITFYHYTSESYCHSSSNASMLSAVRYCPVVKYVQRPALGSYHDPFVSYT
jgi:hypothetical protein